MPAKSDFNRHFFGRIWLYLMPKAVQSQRPMARVLAQIGGNFRRLFARFDGVWKRFEQFRRNFGAEIAGCCHLSRGLRGIFFFPVCEISPSRADLYETARLLDPWRRWCTSGRFICSLILKLYKGTGSLGNGHEGAPSNPGSPTSAAFALVGVEASVGWAGFSLTLICGTSSSTVYVHGIVRNLARCSARSELSPPVCFSSTSQECAICTVFPSEKPHGPC